MPSHHDKNMKTKMLIFPGDLVILILEIVSNKLQLMNQITKLTNNYCDHK